MGLLVAPETSCLHLEDGTVRTVLFPHLYAHPVEGFFFQEGR